MNWVVLAVTGYVVVQIAIGAWIARSVKTESDYINAGRRLGPIVGAFSVFATWFGAEAIVGTSGQVYERGLAGGETDPFGYALALIIVGLFVAAPLWRRGLVTFADFFRERYSPLVEKVLVAMLLPGSVFWAAAQIRAFGQVFSSVSDLDVQTAIACAALLVTAYTIFGGLLADALSDFVQGTAVIVGLGTLAVLAAAALGGVGPSLAAVQAERFVLTGADGTSWLAVAERWAVPICGTIVAVELISRILGCHSASVAAAATVTGGLMYLLVGLIPVYLGLVGPLLQPSLASGDAEQIVPELAAQLMPGTLYALFAGALVAAILSTVNSVLLAAAAQVSHNVLLRFMPITSQSKRVLMARLAVAVLAIMAYVLAATAESVSDLIEVASAAGSTGAFVCLVIGLTSKFGGENSALAALCVGSVSWLIGHLTQITEAPFLASMGLALGSYVIVAIVERKNVRPTELDRASR